MSEPSNKRAWVKITRVGFSIAFLAVVAVAECGALYFSKLNHNYLIDVCSVLAAVGLVCWLKGRRDRLDRAATRGQAAPAADAIGPNPFRFLVRTEFLGAALMLATGSSFGILYFQRERAPVPVARAKAALVPLAGAKAAPAAAGEKRPVVFPPMKLNGLILRGPQSSAIINSKTYFVGDLIGDARVKEITQGKVTVELDGETKVLYLE